MLWRGAVLAEPFLTGASMVIAGDLKTKVVLYPIARDTADERHLLTNWVVWAKLGGGSTPAPRREDWSRQGRLDEALPHLAHWRFDGWVDVPALVRRTATFYEYPMCDRDPPERWERVGSRCSATLPTPCTPWARTAPPRRSSTGGCSRVRSSSMRM